MKYTTEEMNYFIEQSRKKPSLPIPIRGCPRCEPGLWEEQGPSKGTYKCHCRKEPIKIKLKEKNYGL